MTDTQMVTTSRKYEPLAPVGNAGGLKALLEAQRNGIATALPKHITPERLIKTMLVAANRTPDLLQCTQASILETINRAAELGLDLSGTLGEAYPVPFNNKNKDGTWSKQCQLIIGYRGFEKLAWQSGEFASIDAEMVYQNDHFVFKKGTTVIVEWSPALTGDRGDAIGAYACFTLKSGGSGARFLPISDIEKIRTKSKSGDSPAWRDHYDEMGRKCAIKRTLKDAPLSTEKLVKAIETDNEDYELHDVLSAETIQRPAASALNEAINANKAAKRAPAPEPPQNNAADIEALREAEEAAQERRRQVADKTPSDAAPTNDEPPMPKEAADTQAGEVKSTAEQLDQSQFAYWPNAEKLLQAKAKDWQIDRGNFKAGLVKTTGFGLTPDKSTIDQRIELYYAIIEKRWDHKTGVIVAK